MQGHQNKSALSRRSLISSAAGAAVAVSAMSSMTKAAESPKKFKLKYAPDLGAFRQHAGDDSIDNLKFMADEGFSAMFDNGLMGKPPELQEKIASEMTRLGMTLGPFVMYADFSKATLVTPDEEIRKQSGPMPSGRSSPPAAAASGWNGIIRRPTWWRICGAVPRSRSRPAWSS
jgi:hypothetical protein